MVCCVCKIVCSTYLYLIFKHVELALIGVEAAERTNGKCSSEVCGRS